MSTISFVFEARSRGLYACATRLRTHPHEYARGFCYHPAGLALDEWDLHPLDNDNLFQESFSFLSQSFRLNLARAILKAAQDSPPINRAQNQNSLCKVGCIKTTLHTSVIPIQS